MATSLTHYPVYSSMSLERAAFALYLLSVTLMPFQRFPHLIWDKIQLSDIIFLAAFLSWFTALIARQIQWKQSEVYIPLSLYIVAMVLSLQHTPTLQTSTIQLFGNFYLMTLLVLTYHFACSSRRLLQIAGAFLLGASVTAICALIGVGLFYLGVADVNNPFLWNYGTLPPGNYPRVSGIFANGNALCNYLIVGFFVLVGFWRQFRRIVGNVLLIILGIAVIGAAIFTFSVGWGGFVAGGMVVLWIYGKQRSGLLKCLLVCGIAIGGLLLAGLGCISVVMLTHPKRSYVINEGRPAIVQPAHHGVTLPGNIVRIGFEPSVRVMSWQSALQTARRYPVVGQGIGTLVAPTAHRLVTGGIVTYRDAHNAYLNILGQVGVLGFLAFAFFLWKLLKGSSQKVSYNWTRVLLLAAIIGAFFFQGLFGSIEEARHLWWLFGLWVAVRATVQSMEIGVTSREFASS